MKTSTKAALFGLAYVICAAFAFANDKNLAAYFFLLASVITIAASFICDSVEKSS